MAFFDTIFEESVKEQIRTGIPWQVTLAQAAVETGWGEKEPNDVYTDKKSNNIFGIKYNGQGDYVKAWTTEYISPNELDYYKKRHNANCENNEQLVVTGKKNSSGEIQIELIEKFQAYDSIYESILAHSDLLLNAQVYKDAYEYRNDYKKYIDMIASIYATDSNYANMLKQIINDYLTWEGK